MRESDDRRVYSDEEFALILRKAAELEPTASPDHSLGGLTLAEMKAAAAQAGFDPSLVERAARMLQVDAAAKPSLMERLIGGRTRHSREEHFPIVLSEAEAAKLLSAVRIGVGRSGDGHSGATGLTWRSSDDGGSVLSLTALGDQGGTSLAIDLDRRGTLVLGGVLTLAGSFMALLFGGTVTGELVPGFELLGGLTSAGVVLAIARSYWTSSTRSASERVSRLMNSVSGFLKQAGDTDSIGARTQSETAATKGEPPEGTS